MRNTFIFIVVSYLALQWWNTTNNPNGTKITGESFFTMFIVYAIVVLVIIAVFKLATSNDKKGD